MVNNKMYFASANTYAGFKSYFNEIFSPLKLNKIYIIKGGSGTGKSSLMKYIAGEAEKKLYDVEYYYCSSDPTSLDGIIINEINAAIIDGTSPHITDPVYIGAVEKIINLGDFIREDKIKSQKTEIIQAVKEKNCHYEIAYKHLNALNELIEIINKYSVNYIEYEKMNSCIIRLLDKNEKTEDTEYKFISSISSMGYTEYDTLENMADTIYYVNNIDYTGYYFMDNLIKQTRNTSRIISPEPLNSKFIKAVYLKNQKKLFKVVDFYKPISSESNKIININMKRFIKPDLKKNNKFKLKLIKNCYNDLWENMVNSLKNAKDRHDVIEDIYIKSMDFGHKEKYTLKLKNEILK